MVAFLASLCLAVQAGGATHAGLHPADAEFFVECPDVPALLEAYDTAPMARMFQDEEARTALQRMFGMPDLNGRNAVQWGIDAMPIPEEAASDALNVLAQLQAASVSGYAFERVDTAVGPDFRPTGGVMVLDFKTPEAAKNVGDFFFQIGETIEKPATDPGKARSRAFRLGDETSPELWTLQAGRRVAVGGGTVGAARWNAIALGDAPSIAGDERFRATVGKLGPGKGATVFQGYQVRSPIDLWLGNVPEGGEEEELSLTRSLGAFVFGAGVQSFRMQLRDGTFVTEAFESGAKTALPSVGWLGNGAVGRDILQQVHPGVLFAIASTLDGEGFQEGLFAALGKADGQDVEAVRAEVDGKLGFDSRRLFAKLGPDFTLFVYPIKGIGMPKTFVQIDLRETEGVFEDVERLSEVLAAEFPGFKARSSKYKDVPYVTLTLPEEVVSLGEFGSVRPAIAVLDGRLVMTSGSVNMKREIRRLQGSEKDQLPPASYPWTADGETSAVPADTAFLVYMDWASQVEGIFSMARAFGPMISSFAEGLPFDLVDLPDPKLFTKHMAPTLHVVRPVEGGTLMRHDASFAFETWVGLAGIAMRAFQAVEEAFAPMAFEVEEPAPEPSADLHMTTVTRLQDLRTALTVYKLDAGSFPDDLAKLTVPSASYPNGFLDGATEVPTDGWGRPFRYGLVEEGRSYTLWSLGPDGIDQDGKGDDVQDL